MLEIALPMSLCRFSAGFHRDTEEVVVVLLCMVLQASPYFSQSTCCCLTPSAYEVALLRHRRVSLRVESERIRVSPATEQLQRKQVQSLPGTSSGQMGLLPNGLSDTRRGFRTVGQESMECNITFTHQKIRFGFTYKSHTVTRLCVILRLTLEVVLGPFVT